MSETIKIRFVLNAEEAVAEIEVHGFLLDRCATYETTNARRFATL